MPDSAKFIPVSLGW